MILLSTTMYTPPHALHTTPNLPLSHLTHALERRLLLSLLCSFLNTSLATSRPAGVSLGQLPYNHLISKSAEERRTLVRACMMVLLVALDHREPEIAGMGEAKEENAFRYFVSKLVSTTGVDPFVADPRSIERRTLRLCWEGFWAFSRNTSRSRTSIYPEASDRCPISSRPVRLLDWKWTRTSH
jgi:hypothetical protein